MQASSSIRVMVVEDFQPFRQLVCSKLEEQPELQVICEVTDQSIYRWIDDASGKGLPLGRKCATWLLGTARLLDYIEKHQGGDFMRTEHLRLLRRG